MLAYKRDSVPSHHHLMLWTTQLLLLQPCPQGKLVLRCGRGSPSRVTDQVVLCSWQINGISWRAYPQYVGMITCCARRALDQATYGHRSSSGGKKRASCLQSIQRVPRQPVGWLTPMELLDLTSHRRLAPATRPKTNGSRTALHGLLLTWDMGLPATFMLDEIGGTTLMSFQRREKRYDYVAAIQ